MKKIFLMLVICSFFPLIGLSFNLQEENRIKPIFANLLKDEGIDNYHVPAFLIKFVLNYSNDAIDIKPLFNGARFVNIAVCNNDDNDNSESYKRICKGLDLSSYLNLVEIIDNKSKMTIKALLKNDFIRELVILIRDKDSFIAISMTGKIDPKNLANSIAELKSSRHGKL